MNTPLFEADAYDRKIYSQFGEDGILLELVRRLRPVEWFVEIGCGDGSENNTRVLLDAGWNGLWIDGDEDNVRKAKSINVLSRHAWATTQWAEALFPHGAECGVLSIDIDGNDYWIWQAMPIRPTIVIIEAQTQRDDHYVMSYKEDYVWDHASRDCGATPPALRDLGRALGYTFVGMPMDPHSPNMFFCRDDLLPKLRIDGDV